MMVDIVFQKARIGVRLFSLYSFVEGLVFFLSSFPSFFKIHFWKTCCQLDFMDNLYQLVFSSNSIFYEF